MSHEEVRSRVLSIIAQQLHIDKEMIQPQTTFDLLGADSVDRVEIIMHLEEEFGIEISDDDAERLNQGTVQETIEYLYHTRDQGTAK